ncbi:unnamed protein product, partial [Symbiodinium necroappetens]
MAEEDKGTSAWYKVPTWDGSPATWRAFQREMEWWMSSLDVDNTKKFNLAARWLLRQSGVVRQRGEEFTPKELEYTKEVRARDPEGVEIVVTEEDPFSGLNKLMAALEEINGKTALDKKGELRRQFYTDLTRRPGERPADFLSRFRYLAAELKSEGIALPSSELGWFLREKLGLDPLRKQLLETALAGREKFEDVEAEALRRFFFLGGLFVAKFGREHLVRTILVWGIGGGSSWETWWQGHRQAYAAEADEGQLNEEPEVEEEELVADPAGDSPDLDEILEIEAEALAAELEQAETEGVDAETLGQIEGCVEGAAEALITMRDAKARLQEVRRDRGFGKAGGTSGPGVGQGSRATPGFKKRGTCFDCGLAGHWAGDAACQRPGAGLARPKGGSRGPTSPSSSAPSGSPQRRVQLVETFAAETEPELNEHSVNETAVASTLEQALAVTCPREVLAGAMSKDKKNVGALDS